MYYKYSAEQIKAAVTALKAFKEPAFVSHEWEELVYRLSNHNDPQLREKMSREMDDIQKRDHRFKVFGK